MSMKKSSDTIGNQTRDLPVCSAVPQPIRHRVPWISIGPMFIEGTINFTNMFCKFWIHSLQTTIWENLLLFHWGHCHSTHSKLLKDYTTDIQPRVHTSQTVCDIFNCNWVDTWWQQSSTHLHTNSTQYNTMRRNTQNICKGQIWAPKWSCL
jgi:hypothetical protein